METILIFGGTFDPIHLGHLNTALKVQRVFNFKHFVFLPCKLPVLKQSAEASNVARITMLELALEPYPDFTIDLREIERDTPSYMVETLKSYREDYGQNVPITLLMGQDAFTGLPRWHQWKEIINLCHLLVIKRPNHNNNLEHGPLLEMLNQHKTDDKKVLLTKPNGHIYQLNAGLYDISSTWIRQKIKQKMDIKCDVPSDVYHYIKEEKLYGFETLGD